MMHLPLDDVYIAMGPGEHDRTFDHADDVPRHLTSVLIARQTAIRCSLVQVNSKFQSHLIETLSQPFAKRGMRITERCAEIPDQAASLSVASPDDHLAHGIQTPKNPIQRIVVATGGRAAFEAAITEKTRMIYVETPVNPTLALTDLEAVTHLARSHGVLTCVDSTFASPFGQRPIEHGIDLVVHSATKFLGGHSDVTAGVIVGTRDLINRLWDALIIYGMILHPFEAWLLARGIQTLTFRMERHNNNSQEVARYLEGHPGVLQVHYPGLASHPQHALARRQMTGFGGVVSFEPKGGYEAARKFVSRLRLAKLAVSLGGTKTLAVHTASMIFAHHTREERKEIGVSEGLVRLAVGIEDVEDIIADFDQALRARTAA